MKLNNLVELFILRQLGDDGLIFSEARARIETFRVTLSFRLIEYLFNPSSCLPADSKRPVNTAIPITPTRFFFR